MKELDRNNMMYLLQLSTVVIAIFVAVLISNNAWKIAFFTSAYIAAMTLYELGLYKSLYKEIYKPFILYARITYISAAYIFLMAIIIVPSYVRPIMLICYPLILLIAMQIAAWAFCKKFPQKENVRFYIFITMLSSTIQGIFAAIVALVFFKVQSFNIISKILW